MKYLSPSFHANLLFVDLKCSAFSCYTLLSYCSINSTYKSNEKAMNRNWSNQKTNPALKTKMEITKITIDKTQWGQKANRVGSSFPKGGHSATQTELKVKWTKTRWSITETLTPKTGNKDPHQNHRLGTVSNTILQLRLRHLASVCLASTTESALQIQLNNLSLVHCTFLFRLEHLRVNRCTKVIAVK